MAQILVIDDEAEERAMMEEILTGVGHRVIAAADGRDGIRRYRKEPADLVITDLFMPNQDGIETIMKLRNESPGVAIIAMSGRAISRTMLAIGRSLGAVGILQKPYTPEELFEVVEKALSGRQE
jgi:CheY-like chemotaxis protein